MSHSEENQKFSVFFHFPFLSPTQKRSGQPDTVIKKFLAASLPAAARGAASAPRGGAGRAGRRPSRPRAGGGGVGAGGAAAGSAGRERGRPGR